MLQLGASDRARQLRETRRSASIASPEALRAIAMPAESRNAVAHARDRAVSKLRTSRPFVITMLRALAS
jgi:hypothetical protein